MPALYETVVDVTGTSVTTSYAASAPFAIGDTDFQMFEVAFTRNAASSATGVTVEFQVSNVGAAADAASSTNWKSVLTALVTDVAATVNTSQTVSASANTTARGGFGTENMRGWQLGRVLYKSVGATFHASDEIQVRVMARQVGI